MIYTFSKFYTGVDINNSNSWIDIDEGSGELSFQLEFGNYTLNQISVAIENGFNSIGTQEYTVTTDRVTRLITVSATSNFSILTATGSHGNNNVFRSVGFTFPDKTGSNSYQGESVAVGRYLPQFKLQSYVSKDIWIGSVDETVNKSADGRVEIVQFGRELRVEFDIKFITNLQMDGTVIKNNPNGLGDAVNFLDYITQGKKFEFMPDENDEDFFDTLLIESTPGFSNGTGFKLKELFTQNLPDIYETGIMRARVVT